MADFALLYTGHIDYETFAGDCDNPLLTAEVHIVTTPVQYREALVLIARRIIKDGLAEWDNLLSTPRPKKPAVPRLSLHEAQDPEHVQKAQQEYEEAQASYDKAVKVQETNRTLRKQILDPSIPVREIADRLDHQWEKIIADSFEKVADRNESEPLVYRVPLV